MFLLSAQNNFYITLSSYVEGHVKKESSLKSGCFLGDFFVELIWQSFSGRYNFLEPPVFCFSNSPPYGLEEPREL